MRSLQSLDELISRKAAEFADQLRQTAAVADKEEEIRVAVERQLAFIEREAGIKLEGRQEFTVAKGRADSVYTRVLIEYKNPNSPAARIGPSKDSPGCKKVVEQIKNSFHDLRDDLGHTLDSLFGVGFDGNHFVFVRFRDNKWEVQEPAELNKHSAERFLWPLFNLGQKGNPQPPLQAQAIPALGGKRLPCIPDEFCNSSIKHEPCDAERPGAPIQEPLANSSCRERGMGRGESVLP